MSGEAPGDGQDTVHSVNGEVPPKGGGQTWYRGRASLELSVVSSATISLPAMAPFSSIERDGRSLGQPFHACRIFCGKQGRGFPGLLRLGR